MTPIPFILVIDLETTDQNPSQGQIVEIGAALLDTKTGAIEEAFHVIIKEKDHFNHHAWIFDHSDLTPDIVNKGVSIERIRKPLQTLLNQYPTIAYNCQFDFAWLKSRGFTIPKTVPDPMYLMQDILQIPGYYGDYKWPSVQECLDYLDISETEPHRGHLDAMLEAKIIWYLVQHGQITVK